MSPKMVQTWGNTVLSSLSLTLGSFGSRSGLEQLLEGLRRRCEEAAKSAGPGWDSILKNVTLPRGLGFPEGKVALRYFPILL